MRYRNIDKLEPELEREAYQIFHRYLKHVPLEELCARYLAIRRHTRLAEITAKATPDLWNLSISDHRNPMFWLRKELLTVEEYRLREEILPSDRITPVGMGHHARPVSLLGKSPGGEEFLVKYGKCRHLRPMLEHGAIRLTAASSYIKKENNEARLDDELNKHDFTPSEHVTVTDSLGNDLPVHGNIRYTKSISDYYLLCMSNEFDAALFTAFEDDGDQVGCLIIHDPITFALRLAKASQAVISDCEFGHFNVEYYDPYELEPNQRPHPVMSKSINFAYQKEYRFFWALRQGDRPHPFVDVQLGPLEDIAELVGCSTT